MMLHILQRSVYFLLCVFVLSYDSAAQSSACRQEQESIRISTQKTSLLIFPYPIEAVDIGIADVLARPFQKGSSILKVKAAKSHFSPTNLSILTREGQLYAIDVYYDSLPPQQVYYFGKAADSLVTQRPVSLAGGWLDREKAAQIAAVRPAGFFKRHRQFRMKTQLRNVLYKDDLLFFSFEITNASKLPYDLAFIRCYQRDRKQRKRSSQTEKELIPVHQYISTGNRIPGDSSALLVLVFEKFTIADHKQFAIELYEQTGDRVLRMNVTGDAILRANTW